MRGAVTQDLRTKLDIMGIQWRASSVSPETKTLVKAGLFEIKLAEMPINERQDGLMMLVSSNGAIDKWEAIEAIAFLARAWWQA